MSSYPMIAEGLTGILYDTLTISRAAAGEYVAGVWVAGEASEVTGRAQITPARGRDLERLPEGRRSASTIRIITTLEMRLGDVVTWRGVEWEVDTVQDWGLIAGYYDALATQVDVRVGV